MAIELAAAYRTGQVLRCTRRMLRLTRVGLEEYESQPAGALGQVIIPGAGKMHGETVVLTPEQRRAVDDARKKNFGSSGIRVGDFRGVWRHWATNDSRCRRARDGLVPGQASRA